MPTGRITKRSVDALTSSGKDSYLWDVDLPGFGVKVTSKGRKIYVIQYRIPGAGRSGFARRLRLGDHGRLTPEKARLLARNELAKVAHGIDPASERSARRAGATVTDVGEAFLADVQTRRKSRTAAEYRRLWEKHVLPVLGRKAVSEVTAPEVRRLHRSLSETPYLANRVAAVLGSFFPYAQKEGARKDDNPARAVVMFEEKARERFLTPAEFRRLGDALSRAEREGLVPAPRYRGSPRTKEAAKHRPNSADRPIPANPFAVAAIRLLALTGCRENEILSLRWDAVDLDRGYLRLSETKTGKSNRPLSGSAAAVLSSLPRIAGNPFVLPGRKPGQHLKEIKHLWYAVRYAAGLEDVRLHDLRHSFASVPASSGESLLVVRSLLGHRNVATTERYAHLGDDPVKRAAERAGSRIATWLNGTASATDATPEE